MLKVQQKIFLFLTIFICLISATFLANVFSAPKTVYADNTVTTTWDGSFENITKGTGTQDDPYLIETANQFAMLTKLHNDTSFNNSGVYYRLETNVDLNNRRFNGIGVSGAPFKANFDGNNCTISKFRYGTVDSSTTTINAGLFNSVEGGSVKNLVVSTSNITIQHQGNNGASLNLGVICGLLRNSANIENCLVTSANVNLQMAGSFSEAAVGGIVGRIYHASNVFDCSVNSTTLKTSFLSSLSEIERLHTGIIAGTAQSNCKIYSSYSDNTNEINLVMDHSCLGQNLPCYVGGICGSLSVGSGISKDFSTFNNVIFSGANTNKYEPCVGGIVGYIEESFINNSYTKNNLFNINTLDATLFNTVYFGGIIGYANANNNLYNTYNNEFLSYSYHILTEEIEDVTYNYFNYLIGYLNLTKLSSSYLNIPCLKYCYYIVSENDVCDPFETSTTVSADWSINSVTKCLTATEAKSISNYIGFDTEFTWSNDLPQPINDGHPILKGVGNDLKPAEKQTYTISISVFLVDENGTTEQAPITKDIEEHSSVTHQLEVLENYTVTQVSTVQEKVTVNIDDDNMLTIANPTANDTVVVYITKDSFTVTLAIKNNIGGTVNFADGYTSSVFAGGSTGVIVLADTGYRFDYNTGIELSDTNLTTTQISNGFSVANITSDLTVTVEFIKTFNIYVSTSNSTMGLISRDNSSYVDQLSFVADSNSSVNLYAKVNSADSYLFVKWKTSEGAELSTSANYTFEITSDLNIIAEFDIKYYQITVEIIEQTHSENNIVKVNYAQVQNGEIVNNLQMLQVITLHYIADENNYIASVKINDVYLPQENINYGVFSFDLVGDTVIQIEYVDYLTVNLYEYSNTLENQQSYANITINNCVGFASSPILNFATEKFKVNETVTVYASANEKYIFDGWFNTSNFANATPVSTNSTYQFTIQNSTTLYAKFSINTYTVTFNQILIDENGEDTITLETVTLDLYGDTELLVAKPDNYNFVKIESQCGAIYNEVTSKIIVNNLIKSDTVTITFEKQKYNVTFNAGTGGQIQLNSSQVTQVTLYHGESLVTDIVIENGYKLYTDTGVQISGSCDSTVTQNNITLANITSDISVNVVFTKYYTVTIITNNETMGLVGFDTNFSASCTQKFDAGSNFTIIAQETNNNAFEFKRWTDEGGNEISTLKELSFEDLQQDLNLTAVFAKIGYSINVILEQEIASNNNHFTINDQNINYLDGQDYGTQITIKYNLDSGAYLQKIIVTTPAGNKEILPDAINDNKIRFPLVANVTATVYLKAYKFNINLTANNGSLTFDDNSTNKTITAYDTVDVIAQANIGYEFDQLTGDTSYFNQTDINSNDIITLSNFTSAGQSVTDINIIVNFKIKTYKVVVNYGVNGIVYINNVPVNPSQQITYNYGSNLMLDFVANDEYYLNSVSLNNVDITSQLLESKFYINGLTEDLTFNVDFGIKKYNLNIISEFSDITFDIYANGVLSNQTYFESGTTIAINIDIPYGYSYQGLYYLDTQIPASEYFTILQDTVLYAKVLAQISIEQSPNGEVTINGSNTTNYYEYGSQLFVESFANTGYQFTGFDDGIQLSQNNTLLVTKSITFKPVFTSKPTEVVLTANREGSINSYVNGTYYIGDVINIKTNIVELGYHFVGYEGQYSGELLNELITTYTILPQDAENGRVEINAVFQIDVFDVLITSNFGGKLSEIGSKTYAYGMVINVEVEIYDKYYLSSILNNGVEDKNKFIDSQYQIYVTEPITVEFVFAPYLWSDYAQMPKGLGKSDNPFLITTPEELAFISVAINNNYKASGNQVRYDYAYYKLTCDIDLNGKFWTPIGTIEHPFNGVFDFNFYEVQNLSVLDDVSLYKYGGLFDVIGEHGKIINQFRNYTTLVIFIIGGSVILALLVLLVVFIEKRRRKPKRVIILPVSMINKSLLNDDTKTIKKPDISKLDKK